ncbi:6474_t:CDS:2, partial [Paraglomus brasilianum]
MARTLRTSVQCFCSECNGCLRDPRIKKTHEIESSLQTQQTMDDTASICSEEIPEILNFTADESDDDSEYDDECVNIESETESDNNGAESESVAEDESFEAFGTHSSNSTDDNEDDDVTFNSTEMEHFMWIILFLFKMQVHFKIPTTHIDIFIKFLRIILIDIDKQRFASFPNSIYVARKLIHLRDLFKTYVSCSKCHTLYDLRQTVNYKQDGQLAIRKCSHIEFPNNRNHITESCNFPLTKQIRLFGNRIANKPLSLFPLGSLKDQLKSMYQRPGFEKMLSHWRTRQLPSTFISDIYDGKRWKNFADKNNELFFNIASASTHLGLMFNLDWFQMFSSSTHSTGALYGVIMNLPPNERFKPENMLVALIMPGPREASLHQINNYISPFVNQLLDLWDGVSLITNDYPEGSTIRAALIGLACDLPAGRKLCGHISYNTACHWCYKTADSSRSFGGFTDMGEWFRLRNATKHREDAMAWHACQTKNARKDHVSKTHARWSELLRLPYFDPITFLPIDGLHNLWLGDGSWLMKRIWIEEGKITKRKLQIISSRLKTLTTPPDIGRMPTNKVDVTDGFVGLTADEWKNFYLVAAAVVLYDLLEDEVDRQILTYFIRACSIFVSKILTPRLLEEAHQLVIKLLRLIEEAYGKAKISPNLHLTLHIAESCLLYGPLSSFWCYGYERMNGFL